MLELSPRTVVEDDQFLSALDDEQREVVQGMVNQYESEMVVPPLVSALKVQRRVWRHRSNTHVLAE